MSPEHSNEDRSKKTVVVCDTQPITAEGLRTLLTAAGDLEFLSALNSLEAATQLMTARPPDVVIVDKGFGMRIVLDWIHDLKMADAAPAVTVWGVSMTEAEALRLLQAGAKGIVRKTADLESILSCLRTVASGRSWMEDCVFRDSARQERYPRSELTPREHQVLEMVEQGFKNKEIALELGIRPGTVKIHLKHIFEKTGVRGRYGLAISGLKERGLVSMVS
ncbi:MAG TPA: response regulator transcription factor [Bryobacteraceae bacterium]|jgi:two-component system nitrate/nitrite response regulator NarL|nr:response regulator transcription factor [Bryobacteraceae bacterium]